MMMQHSSSIAHFDQMLLIRPATTATEEEEERTLEDTMVIEEESSSLSPPMKKSHAYLHRRYSSFGGGARMMVLMMKKEEFKRVQNMDLIKDFAYWLSGEGERYVSEKNFEHDIADGVALCMIMSKVEGSNLERFHKVAPVGGVKARENIELFETAAKRLNLPVSFGVADIESKNLPEILCTLIFLAHLCYTQGICTNGEFTNFCLPS